MSDNEYQGKHRRGDSEPESRPTGNTDPSKRGRGGTDPNVGQPGKDGRHAR